MAFGHEWDTISRWRFNLASILSGEMVEWRLQSARWLADMEMPLWSAGDDVEAAIKADGAAYKVEMGFTLVKESDGKLSSHPDPI